MEQKHVLQLDEKRSIVFCQAKGNPITSIEYVVDRTAKGKGFIRWHTLEKKSIEEMISIISSKEDLQKYIKENNLVVYQGAA